jgi:phosphonate transport system permease protein
MAIENPRSWRKYDLRDRLIRYLALVLTLVIGVASWQALNIHYQFALTAPWALADLFGRMYPPDVGYSTEIAGPLVETINIAILGTGLAIIMSLPVAYIGAENTTFNRYTYVLGKLIIVVSRSVNVIVWALIFVVVFGAGALSGVLAVAFRSIGFCAKLLAEGIEEIDPGQVEAIRATGAPGPSILVYGVVPQIKPLLIGITTYRWDINVREATIIGFVGAGGIGVQLQTQVNFLDWRAVLTILIAILGIVLFSEVLSAYLRKKVT